MNVFFTSAINVFPRSNSFLNIPKLVAPGENTIISSVPALSFSEPLSMSVFNAERSAERFSYGFSYGMPRSESPFVSLSVPVPASS